MFINCNIIDAQNLEQIIEEIDTPCFGFEKKLIIAKNTSFFKKETKKKLKEDLQSIKEKLLKYLEENFKNINNSVVLIFIEEEVNKNDLMNFIEKNGVVCNFEFQKPNQIISRIKAITNAYKVNIDNATINYLLNVVEFPCKN